ncbi:hypothetical protein [Saccharopolyspora spinosa]|uniref:Uncharacterized protein n=1 Tax=Saccharopolyspora spinosa TaxID=60894 RepID=A0A2N3Y0V4_SACSN|nr:hypothetical protein [Saccharopolyspora spinosa]PKW16558.1 hypothetical protein A8926_4400 [Saccharopolyspora spinosa]
MSVGGRVIEAGIGPWSLSADGSALVRQEHGYAEGWPRESGSWSPAERIEVRPGPSVRVTLVGESVARGFLLDPVVTLADLCRDAFKRVGADIELVDLAVNNLSPQGAVKLCRAAIELGSAAIVLYVGNNFLRSTPWLEPDQRSSTAELFQCGGYPEYLAARRRALVTLAREFRGETERLCTEANMPLVVVVPAVNLLDWRSPWVVPAWLPAGRVAEWAVTQEELAALPDEDTSPDLADRRSELADRLAGLDGGSTPRPLEIIGRDMVCRGRETGGLELLTEAVGVGADPAHYGRRCPLEVATELRLLGATPGFRLVDVPARTQQRWGSRAFGKDAFLDYCHHTSESLGAVAGDIAVEVAAAIGAPVSGVPARSEPDLPADRLAECYLLAALHNQHWGQSAATVQHWIAAALRTDRSSVDNLVSYFAMSVPTALFWLSVASACGPGRMHRFLKNFSHQAALDAEFAARALRVLGADSAVLQAGLAETWRGLRVEDVDELNLLEPFWQERDGPPHQLDVFTGERGPTSRYGFVTAGDRPLGLETVLTLGTGLPTSRFVVTLNGGRCYVGQVTDEWECHRLTLPVELLVPGANELSFRWSPAARAPQSTASAMSVLGLGPESLHLVRIARMRLTAKTTP